MNLENIPQESLDHIASYLPASAIAALGQTSKSLKFRITRSLHAHAVSPVGDRPALHWAVRQRHLPLVNYLLRHFPIDLPDARKRTPLHIAVRTHKCLVITTLLVDAGAEIDAVDDDGQTPMHRLCSSMIATLPTLMVLLANGANPNAICGQRSTPLGNAILDSRREDFVGALLAAGADPRQPTTDNDTNDLRTPLHGAAYYNLATIIASLLSAGADINSRTTDGESALHYAATTSSYDAISILVTSGASLDVADNLGDTALTISIKRHASHIAILLLQAGASGDFVSTLGTTAMTCACFTGQITIVRELLVHGWGMNTEREWQAADTAVKRGIRVCRARRSTGRGYQGEAGWQYRLNHVLELVHGEWSKRRQGWRASAI